MIRDYQRLWLDQIYAAWDSGARNVFGTLPTGAGKTFCFVTAIRERGVPAVVVAHRQELVAQASLALNREGVVHSIEAPRETVRAILHAHMATHGNSFYSPGADVHVAGVHTLAARGTKIRWLDSIGLAVVDEGHHVTTDGVWHRALELFKNARALFPSAHCIRADGAGLGRGVDGLADALVIGPSARELISRGYLSDYRIAIPRNDLDVGDVPIGASGDYSAVKLSAAVHASRLLVGGVAEHYVRRLPGKLGLTFATDIAHAGEIRAAYAALGVTAEIITGKTPADERSDIMRQFRGRRILQLVSVDVLGEGTDVPDVEVVSMARPTMSFQMFAQQLGRMMRVSVAPEYAARWDTYTDAERLSIIAAGPKPCGWLYDHVGNFARHYQQRGMPCSPQKYTLSRSEKKSRTKSDAVPLRTCENEECMQPYPRTFMVCPHCGDPAPLPAGRSTPEQVDGDLVLLDPAVMQALWRDVAKVDGPARVPGHLQGSPAEGAVKRTHAARQLAQSRLRERMTVWGGWRLHVHGDERQAHREFFFKFGIDVVTAQTLGAKDAVDLYERVHCDLHANNIHSTVPPVMDGVLDMTEPPF